MTNSILSLKIASTQVVETSVSTNNSSSQDYIHLDDQPTTNSSGSICVARLLSYLNLSHAADKLLTKYEQYG